MLDKGAIKGIEKYKRNNKFEFFSLVKNQSKEKNTLISVSS